MIESDLKERIRRGDQIVGVSAPMTSTKAQLETTLGADDYDFISVDTQHSPFNEERLVEFCAITTELNIPVHFRIKHTRHTYLVGNLLDLGPALIEVPQTETLETAQEAVDYFYFPQFGKRSWGGAARYGVQGREDRLEYAEWWNNTGVLWLQIESLHAITRAAEIALPGVDCLSWGPADLSFNREANPEHPLQTDDDCVEYTLKVLKGTDTKLLIRSYDPNLRNKYRDMGVTMLLERPKA
jgi:2-keto-3-deoxy-L-rhamnonate aldolase RhmA